MTEIKLRDTQAAVIEGYEGGQMGVAAVPGSGKTFTLSYLAARLVEELSEAGLADEQEVLIVTMTNSAVNTFRHRIATLLQQERGLLPYIGYRVRTLHGLAHDIVRMRPGLVGLSENFEIVDERVANNIVRELAENWVRLNSELLFPYVGGNFEMADEPQQVTYMLRKNAPDLIETIARETIRLAKDNGWDPAQMRAQLDQSPANFILARIGIEVYEGYERSLSYRSAVDFDDLVRYAMQAFELDSEFLERLQARWPYILEDEAQDSSLIQDKMLSQLSGERNWVRVGDSNQSIFTTFTTADSNILRRFIEEPDVAAFPLPVSGRSSQAIMDLANELVRWIRNDPLYSHLSDTFYDLQIKPTEADDPQPNPEEGQIYIDWDSDKNVTPESEVDRVVKSIERWLPDHPDWTVAVLTPENHRGFKVVEALKERNIPYEELLRSTSATRDAAARLQITFEFLADPTNGRALARLFRDVWWPLITENSDDEVSANICDNIARGFRNLKTIEDFLWPGPEGSWLPSGEDLSEPGIIEILEVFRAQLRVWLEATTLPVDQLALTVSQVLFKVQTDLALAHKIAVVLRGIADNNPAYRLPELTGELRMIAQNERRFLGFDDATSGYEPAKGIVTVATMHAAKGLEWDRVYLMSINNYSFPLAQDGNSYIAEKWFIRDNLNIQAEARAQIELLMADRPQDYVEGKASAQARIDYAQERLRLLYVGITRARRDLSLTWNMGRYWNRGKPNRANAAMIHLKKYLGG